MKIFEKVKIFDKVEKFNKTKLNEYFLFLC